MAQATGELKELLQALIREALPELNGFQFPMKAKVVKVHEAGGMVGEFNKHYSVDVQPLKADGSADENKPVIPDVPIDILWAGVDRAVMALPPIGAVVRVEFYYWDPSHPFVSGVLADRYSIPDHPLGSFIIQQKNGVHIRIQPDGSIGLQTGQAQLTLTASGQIEIGPGMVSIGADGQISLAGGGPAVARVGDKVSCPCGTGTIASGSAMVTCGG